MLRLPPAGGPDLPRCTVPFTPGIDLQRTAGVGMRLDPAEQAVVPVWPSWPIEALKDADEEHASDEHIDVLLSYSGSGRRALSAFHRKGDCRKLQSSTRTARGHASAMPTPDTAPGPRRRPPTRCA